MDPWHLAIQAMDRKYGIGAKKRCEDRASAEEVGEPEDGTAQKRRADKGAPPEGHQHEDGAFQMEVSGPEPHATAASSSDILASGLSRAGTRYGRRS